MIPNQWYVVLESNEVKPVGPLFTRLAAPSNLYILHQDRRVVNTQRPKLSALRMTEQLIQGDRPIVEYRRRRQALIDAATQKA